MEATVAALARADLLLDRYGVLTRGCLQVEDSAGGFSQLYRIYSAAEDRALVRRGYFIEGLGAAQFAAPATVDLLRSTADSLSVPASPQGFGATPVSYTHLDVYKRQGQYGVDWGQYRHAIQHKN